MTTYRYYTVDVFAERPFEGNPLAVVPDARGLETDQMQLLAREFNYSESAFVFPHEDDGKTFRVRIFTPAEELPFAGHPTIGTASVLAMIGAVQGEDDRARLTFMEGAGPVPVTVDLARGQTLHAELTAPQAFSRTPASASREDLAAILGLDAEDLLGDEEPAQVIGCGLPFVLVPLRTLAAAKRARLHLEAWEKRIGERLPAMVYLMVRETEGDADLHVRLFAPVVGVSEDPATGSAATALAGYLAERIGEASGGWRWTVEQGIEMGRPSRLEISAEKREGSVTTLRCAGSCAPVFAGTFEL